MPVTDAEQQQALTKARALILWMATQGWRGDRTSRLALGLVAKLTEGRVTAETLDAELQWLVAEENLTEDEAG